MHTAHQKASEFRDTIGAFCQCLRTESDAILQTCAAFEKLQGYLSAIAHQGYAHGEAHHAKQRHTIEMAMMRTIVTLDEIFAAHDAAAHAYQVLDPIAAAFATDFLGDDSNTHEYNEDPDD
ncbi:MAG: hypothetical protein ACKO83_12800 [Roseiflexaceae bacterium]